MKKTRQPDNGYLIYQTKGGLWVLDLRHGSLRIKRGFQKYVQALQAVQLLALHLNIEDKNCSRFKRGA